MKLSKDGRVNNYGRKLPIDGKVIKSDQDISDNKLKGLETEV
jgi:hypothetical protein